MQITDETVENRIPDWMLYTLMSYNIFAIAVWQGRRIAILSQITQT